MLLSVQLTQIARAMTTYEAMHGKHAGPVTTALATGSLSAEGAQINTSGAGPDPAIHKAHNHAHKEGCWTQWKKLLGLDTFIATAMHGSRAGEVQARARENPFNQGVIRNCQDFWCDAGGARGIFTGTREGNAGLLGGQDVDYGHLYTVPTAGMRYRNGGYQTVPDAEEQV